MVSVRNFSATVGTLYCVSHRFKLQSVDAWHNNQHKPGREIQISNLPLYIQQQ